MISYVMWQQELVMLYFMIVRSSIANYAPATVHRNHPAAADGLLPTGEEARDENARCLSDVC
jgi:hypothetical protein